jgi:hypothetical protein
VRRLSAGEAGALLGIAHIVGRDRPQKLQEQVLREQNQGTKARKAAIPQLEVLGSLYRAYSSSR